MSAVRILVMSAHGRLEEANHREQLDRLLEISEKTVFALLLKGGIRIDTLLRRD
jgi:hypothetical protein